jgi:rSAM/selenodomain-associated transferase 1
MQRRTLVVMVKAPVMGRVKTRLAREVGSIEALRFYRSATAALLRRLAFDPRWRTVLAIDPPRACRASHWSRAIARSPQCRGDLGVRMRDQLGRAPHGPVVLIGSDIPGIAPRHVADAFAALRCHDSVFGPAEDGGYWLIGLCAGFRPPGGLFDHVRWSTPHALADTRANLSGRKVAFVATLFDVDDAADWRRWKSLPVHGKAA